jgi:branched-chain amino acid transport system permease protein
MLQALFNGLVQGSIYAIIALGYTMVYGILLLINFAHGEILMVGAYVSVLVFGALAAAGLAASTAGVLACLAAALLCAMAVSALYGYSLERIAYRPLRHAPPLAPLISAIGASIFLQNYVALAQGSAPIYFPVNGTAFGRLFGEGNILRFGTVRILPLDLLIVVVCVALMAALYVFIMRTRTGMAMRATSQDKVAAGLMGISIDRVISTTFVIGSGLAAVAGMLLSLYTTQAKYDMGFMAGMKAFTAEGFGIWRFGADYKEVYAFVVLLVVLILRPRGILGERVAEKV